MEEDEKPSGIVDFLHGVLSEAFSTYDSEDLGAQFLGDWIVVAEVHTEKEAVLRIVSSDRTPVWRQQSLVGFAADDLRNDMLIYRLTQRSEEE